MGICKFCGSSTYPRSKLGTTSIYQFLSYVRVSREQMDPEQSSCAHKAPDLELGACHEIQFLMSLPFVGR